MEQGRLAAVQLPRASFVYVCVHVNFNYHNIDHMVYVVIINCMYSTLQKTSTTYVYAVHCMQPPVSEPKHHRVCAVILRSYLSIWDVNHPQCPP